MEQCKKKKQPICILGGGSNTLFLENYSGTILLNRIPGIKIHEKQKSWEIHANAGEIWHKLVKNSIHKNIPGLENMALIPGYVGAAPIQNIGAYGVEFQNLCKYVDIITLNTGKKTRLYHKECKFGYRKSIFQTKKFTHNHAITAIGLHLKKNWHPTLQHNTLKHLEKQKVTPQQIYQKICSIRKKKFPNPKLFGNAGSFFTNPIIHSNKAKTILHQYPYMPYQIQSNKKIKLSAAWLIENCGLKGYRLGNAAVYNKHALIIINTGKAHGKEIIKLAKYIKNQVMQKFSIKLKPEVRCIGKYKEIHNI
ncbi:MAG: UDP-N-acetylenolpyruvoylglucosamine reductase [Candidatus Westeberhardia cardiocondylae]|nr:UDP-N-acetylenolpyruvoylglucosamine reductase [Candidatus Westeberhardia cardiocondylae]